MSELTINGEQPPDVVVTNAERITRERIVESVIVSPQINDTWTLDARGSIDDLSEEEFEFLLKRIDEIIEPGHTERRHKYGSGDFGASYIVRLTY